METQGKIIVAFGIPGSGKSSVTEALGQLSGKKVFHEPEEPDWGDAVRQRDLSGNFTAIMWFRAQRVPQLYQADCLRGNREVVFADSYYDKLFYLYMHEESLRWLFDETIDPYAAEMIAIAKKDYETLPDANAIIFFHIDRKTWERFLSVRNRNLDQDVEFLNQCFDSQAPFLLAAQRYCREANVELVVFDQVFDSPESSAERLHRLLIERNLL
ncbi:hypothetical protein [Mucilaginibacter segetis]|uniref:Uncharacterized protein n=1 Tax=Mucilaginibacter segetis TaxID=2793071 RepID=A0A934PTI6_9SPHI|nr:hypothetical protein [Mucilaginibacter segetis]MBK0379321.1 hypothetical protein [Mucilaginibacter segetis]